MPLIRVSAIVSSSSLDIDALMLCSVALHIFNPLKSPPPWEELGRRGRGTSLFHDIPFHQYCNKQISRLCALVSCKTALSLDSHISRHYVYASTERLDNVVHMFLFRSRDIHGRNLNACMVSYPFFISF